MTIKEKIMEIVASAGGLGTFGLILIFIAIGYAVFKFARRYLMLIGALVLIIGIVLTIIAGVKKDKDTMRTAIICDIAGGIMLGVGIYLNYFVPGA